MDIDPGGERFEVSDDQGVDVPGSEVEEVGEESEVVGSLLVDTGLVGGASGSGCAGSGCGSCALTPFGSAVISLMNASA